MAAYHALVLVSAATTFCRLEVGRIQGALKNSNARRL